MLDTFAAKEVNSSGASCGFSGMGYPFRDVEFVSGKKWLFHAVNNDRIFPMHDNQILVKIMSMLF